MVVAHGCSNQLQWARLWRNRAAPRATALERRLGAKGGYCDCEALMNAYVRRRGDLEPNEPAPACRGVGRGSSQPCDLWMARPRGGWW